MRNLLKYVLVFIVTAVFWGRAEGHGSAISANAETGFFSHLILSQQSISSPDTECCVPRQVSSASTTNIQSSARRTSYPNRSNIEFAKSGKIINADIRFFIQRKSIITHSTLIEPAHRLLYLGKLII
ncbi:MAG: hypothetical protein IJ954_00005 [Bacteroidales bacterium]|nr:hypothetical protein [Bacteroidales bacterium]